MNIFCINLFVFFSSVLFTVLIKLLVAMTQVVFKDRREIPGQENISFILHFLRKADSKTILVPTLAGSFVVPTRIAVNSEEHGEIKFSG